MSFHPRYTKKVYPHSKRATELSKRAYYLNNVGYYISLLSMAFLYPLTSFLHSLIPSPSNLLTAFIYVLPMGIFTIIHEVIGAKMRHTAERWAEEDMQRKRGKRKKKKRRKKR